MAEIQTYLARMVDPEKLTGADVDIRDIAHSLARLCRFGGHTVEFYSVAQHCLHCSAMVLEVAREAHTVTGGDQVWTAAERLWLMRWALLHDAHEAFIGDICRPMAGKFYGLAELKAGMDAVIRDRFGLNWPDVNRKRAMLEVVKTVDERMLQTERDACLLQRIGWPGDDDPASGPQARFELEGRGLPVLSPIEAEAAFIERFVDLWGQADGWADRWTDRGNPFALPSAAEKAAAAEAEKLTAEQVLRGIEKRQAEVWERRAQKQKHPQMEPDGRRSEAPGAGALDRQAGPAFEAIAKTNEPGPAGAAGSK